MKVDRVLPCVCLGYKPTCADSIYAGMPQLKVTPDGGWFEAYCPNCVRGGRKSYTEPKRRCGTTILRKER